MQPFEVTGLRVKLKQLKEYWMILPNPWSRRCSDQVLSDKPPGGWGEVSRGEAVDEELQLLQGTLSNLLHTNWVYSKTEKHWAKP